MRSGLLCAIQGRDKKLFNKFRCVRALIVAGMMLATVPAMAQVVADSSTFQEYTICAGSVIDIRPWLSATDLSEDATLTWHLISGPTHGTLTGLESDQSASAGVSVLPPSPIIYTADTSSLSDEIDILVSDGSDNGALIEIILDHSARPTLVLINNNIPVCAGSTTASLSYSNLTNAGPTSYTIGYSGQEVVWTVPNGVSSLNFDVQGARGGRQNATPPVYLPGNGGRVQGTLTVSSGQPLFLFVGGVGGDGTSDGASGGFNGGGNASFFLYGSGGGGGGASDIRIGNDLPGDRVVVAGGGAGDGWDSSGTLAGGAGGDLTGGNSALNGGVAPTNFAGGGTQLAGGAGAQYAPWMPGFAGSLGTGGDGSFDGISGGGGGGYYGGGGGVWTGGGGGSSYTNTDVVSGAVYTSGYDSSNGVIVFNYVIPATYTIVWSPLAHAAHFADVSDNLPAGAIPLTIPDDAPPSVYTGTLTVTNATCTSPEYVFTVSASPIPTVNVFYNSAVFNGDTMQVCNGDSIMSDINFPGTDGIIARWHNSNPSIGLVADSSGKIARFAPSNLTTDIVIASFTVTPVFVFTTTPTLVCEGPSQTFSIRDVPIPSKNSTNRPAAKCDSQRFFYSQDPVTAGTTFTWSRAPIPGLVNDDTTGSGLTINEILINNTSDTIPVVYIDTLNLLGCISIDTITQVVYPLPVLISTLNPAPVCSGITFSYDAIPSFDGTSLAWSRAVVSGLSDTASSGGGSIDEILTDTTVHPVAAVYVYTLSVNSGLCVYTQNVTVTVNPTPTVSINVMPSVCSGAPQSFLVTSATDGTTYTWSRDTVSGITNAAKSGMGATINDTLVNNTAFPIVVTYADTLLANGCSNVQYLTDTVNPIPTMNISLIPDSICSNTVFIYRPSSATPGTAFAWGRDTVAGIDGPAVSGLDSVVEVLINTTHGIIPVTYVYTLTANSCMNTQDVTVKVNPTPALMEGTDAPSPICDSQVFSYVPVGATAGSSFTWTRAYVAGIDEFPGAGEDSVYEQLINTTYINVAVTYVFDITANGCNNTQPVSLIVHPTPRLSSDTMEVICSGAQFNYYPSSYTPTTTYAWSAATVASVTPTGNSGTGSINETITSTSAASAAIAFVYTLTAYGATQCPHTEQLTVTVNPSPSFPGISIHPPASLCDNTMYQNFGTDVPPPAGISYNWVSDNGYVWAIGASGQYALVNFNTAGVATVYVVVQNDTTGCQSNNTFQVNVGTASSYSPEVIYFANQFICRDADVDSYQWGYDDKVTFDSSIIAGENNQNYYIENPDTVHKYYWVMTAHNGCTQKSYFNTPGSTTGITYVNSGGTDIKIYPNPAAETINVEILDAIGSGTVTVDVANMLGQKVSSVTAADNRARIDVSALPVGCYIADCYRDGVKVASAKFIKN